MICNVKCIHTFTVKIIKFCLNTLIITFNNHKTETDFVSVRFVCRFSNLNEYLDGI